MLIPKQPLSTFTSYLNTQKINKIKTNYNSPVCRRLHASSQLQSDRKNIKDKNNELSFGNTSDDKNLNISLNPVIHQQKVNDRSGKHGKTLNVAILGIPNSGKSTLINQFLGKEVCPYSCKHNTTRKKSRAIYTVDDTQIVFLDTPGLVSLEDMKRFKLEESLYNDPETSCNEADLLLVIQDASNRYVREAIDKKVLRLLCKYHYKVPSILVLNKMDVMPKKRTVWNLIRKLTCNRLDDGKSGQIKSSNIKAKDNVEAYMKKIKQKGNHEDWDEGTGKSDDKGMQKMLHECSEGPVTDSRAEELTKGLLGWPGFRDVFCIAAKKGDGVNDLKNYILKKAKPGGHRYDSELVNDQDPRELVVNIIKSKLLDNLNREVPFKLKPVIEYWQYDADLKTLNICVSIATKNSREAKQLIGIDGKVISMLSNQIEASLMDYFDTIVKLKLEAKLPKAEEDKLSFDAIRPKPHPSYDEKNIFLF